MRRSILLAGIFILFAVDAYAICQKCENDYSPAATCVVIRACDYGATMSACWEADVEGRPGVQKCDGGGTSAGPECNGNDASCSDGGGGGGGGRGGVGGGGWTCYVEWGESCPSDCGRCEYYDGIPPEYNG